MATVDKLTLELEADGINAFIKAMDDAKSGLQKVRENIQKTAKENGLMDKELDKSSKKKKVKDKKADKEKNKSTKSFNKNLQDGTKSLDKMLKTLLAISGISFGISGLMSKSEQSAKVGADLANQARNTNVRTEDIETAQTALQAASINKNALDDLIAKLADNQNSMMAGQGGNAEIQNLIAILNGFDRSGNKVNSINTDPIQTIKDIATLFQSNDDTTKRGIISQAQNAGLSSDVINFLTNPKFFKYWEDSSRLAIQNKDRTDRAQNNNAAITLSQKNLDNQWNQLGENFTPVLVKLNNIGADILKEVNKMQPLFDKALPALSKIADVILKYVSDALKKLSEFGLVEINETPKTSGNDNVDNFFKSSGLSIDLMDKVSDLDKKIDYINNDTAYLTDGSSYKKGSYPWGMSSYEINYLDYAIDQEKKGGYIPQNGSSFYENKIPSNQQLMQQPYSSQYATTNNSNGNIHINELIIQATPEQAGQLVHGYQSFADLIKGSPVTLFNHLGNTK